MISRALSVRNSGRISRASSVAVMLAVLVGINAWLRSAGSVPLGIAVFFLASGDSLEGDPGSVAGRPRDASGASKECAPSGPDAVNAACGASPKPGVPAAVSTGGAAGLPDLTLDGRGFGVASDLGARAMRRIWRDGRRGQAAAGFAYKARLAALE